MVICAQLAPEGEVAKISGQGWPAFHRARHRCSNTKRSVESQPQRHGEKGPVIVIAEEGQQGGPAARDGGATSAIWARAWA